MLARLCGGSALAVSRHLCLDFHALVELDFCHATVALRIAFFFDGIENTAELGQPLETMLVELFFRD